LDGRQRRSSSFVVRIWWEEGEGASVWRGWVQHAVSGEARYFRHISDLLVFVEKHTGPLDQS
jgi:hypothetical protein